MQEEVEKECLTTDVNYTTRCVWQLDDSKELIESKQAACKKLQDFIEKNKESDKLEFNALYQDLAKIEQLGVRLHIPASSKSNEYYVLKESVGGVTEKLSLINSGDVNKILEAISDPELTLKKYMANRNLYQLNPQAILKLPKHGDATSVQRELIALNISGLLGIKTTKRMMVSLNGQPALFIPFDDIMLMKEVADGITQKAIVGNFGQEYTNCSTINPLGEGLCPNNSIEDFGHSFGLFSLCHDPDSFGGYNQNKGIIDAKQLYVFDQGISTTSLFSHDSAFKIEASHIFWKHSRHGQGRNKSLVGDSQLETKLQSLIKLKAKKKNIEEMLNEMEKVHQARIDTLKVKDQSKMIAEVENKQLEELVQLQDDLLHVKKTLLDRIDNLLSFLPELQGKLDDSLNKQSLVLHAWMLEKLFNNPVLFSYEGRPFRNPWGNNHKVVIKKITVRDDGYFSLLFNTDLDKSTVELINEKLEGGLIYKSGEWLVRQDDLIKVSDDLLFPEFKSVVDLMINYLDENTLDWLSNNYTSGRRANTLDELKKQLKIISSKKTVEEQISHAEKAIDALNQIRGEVYNKGFLLHVIKRFHYEIQKKIQVMIVGDSKETSLEKRSLMVLVKQAFKAAVNLDRIELFNRVCLKVISKKAVLSEEFIRYLTDSHTVSLQATRHDAAKKISNKFKMTSIKLLSDSFSFKKTTPTIKNIQVDQAAALSQFGILGKQKFSASSSDNKVSSNKLCQ